MELCRKLGLSSDYWQYHKHVNKAGHHPYKITGEDGEFVLDIATVADEKDAQAISCVPEFIHNIALFLDATERCEEVRAVLMLRDLELALEKATGKKWREIVELLEKGE